MFENNSISPANNLIWDSAFFGLPIARLDVVQTLSSDQILGLLQKLKSQKVSLLYFFVDQNDKKTFDNALKAGGLPVGSRAVFVIDINNMLYKKKVSNIQEYLDSHVDPVLIDLALQSGLYSRFQMDKNLPEGAFGKLYETWITRSVKKEIAEAVFVYKNNHNEIRGLITLGKSGERGDIGLLGVDTESRGQSIGTKLVDEAVHYFKKKKIRELQVVTQGNNLPAVHFYTKYGFLKESEHYIFHFWL